MTGPLLIALSADEQFVDGLAATLAGIVRNTPDTPIRVVILDSGIQDATWTELTTVIGARLPSLELQRIVLRPDQLDCFAPDIRSLNLSNATYSRLLLPELLPDCERILYIDCDVVIDADLRELFSTPLDGAAVGAVLNHNYPFLEENITGPILTPEQARLPAFNSGVMLLDLAVLRQANLLTPAAGLVRQLQGRVQSQAILNYILINNWKPLHHRWNRQIPLSPTFPSFRDQPGSLWHFIRPIKPWHFAPASRRGLVADFHRDLAASGWSSRSPGHLRLSSSIWSDTFKTLRSCARRLRSHSHA